MHASTHTHTHTETKEDIGLKTMPPFIEGGHHHLEGGGSLPWLLPENPTHTHTHSLSLFKALLVQWGAEARGKPCILTCMRVCTHARAHTHTHNTKNTCSLPLSLSI